MSAIIDGCLALVASLCITDPAEIRIRKDSLVVAATIQIEGVQIHSTVTSDNIQIPNRRKMQEVCRRKRCFRYSWICNERESSVICELYYEIDNSGRLRRIEVVSPDFAQLTPALHRLKFAPYPDYILPFDDLCLRQGGDPPICLPRRDGDCDEPVE